MKNVKMTICLMVAVLFMAVGKGFGTTYFEDGKTYVVDYYIGGDVDVYNDLQGNPTTLYLIAGGALRNVGSLYAFNSSTVYIAGGSIVEGGGLFANDSSRVTMTSGTVSWVFEAHNNSQVTISGGSVGSLYADDSGQVKLSGGLVHALYADVDGQITIYGSNFAIDGNPVGFETLNSASFVGSQTLTGTLANGDAINTQFQISNQAEIILAPIPEPATLLLLGLGGMALRGGRK